MQELQNDNDDEALNLFSIIILMQSYGWRIVYLPNGRVQAYCPVFDDQTTRTVPSVQPANWEAISNSEKTWQTTALLPCSLC